MTKLSPPVGPDDHTHGPGDAKITLVEFGDYASPRSRAVIATIQQVLDELGDELCFAYRHFPNTDASPFAMTAAEAAESVARHGGERAFWAMHGILYLNQDALQHDDLIEYARAVGVEPILVADDLACGAMRDRVRRDARSAVRSGARSAPVFFVNGCRFDGDLDDPAAFVAALLDKTDGRAYTTH